jgi:hypothetical protein
VGPMRLQLGRSDEGGGMGAGTKVGATARREISLKDSHRWALSARIAIAACVLVGAFSLLTTQASAANSVRLALSAGYAEGGPYFELVARDNPGTKLVLYVDGTSPERATANGRGRAAFHHVKLIGTGRISFSRVLTGHNGSTYRSPTGYVRYFNVDEELVRFTKSAPATAVPPATETPAPAPKPAPVATPLPPPPTTAPQECTNGTYVNSAGNTVCSPEQSPTVPVGATARCRDGSYSFSQSRSGTCSDHGGVETWL